MGDKEERRSSEDLIRQARERIESRSPEAPEDSAPPKPAREETQEDRFAEYVRQAEEQEPRQAADPSPPSGLPEFGDDRAVLTPPDLAPEPPLPWYQRRWLRVLGGIAVGLFFAFFAGESGPERDDSGAIAELGTINAVDVRVGDCLNDPAAEGEEVFEFEAVPCADAHEMEVFALPTHPADEAFPGDEAFHEWGAQRCYDAFAVYMGAPWEASLDLDFWVYWPSEEAWDDGDRDVICAAYSLDGPVLRGSVVARGPSAATISLGMGTWSSVDVGDCLAYQTEDDPIDQVERLDCAGLHDFEVYSVSAYPQGQDAAFPGDDALFGTGDGVCASALDRYVGRPVTAEGALSYFVVWPLQEEWQAGDRSLVCVAATVSGKQMIGSVATDA